MTRQEKYPETKWFHYFNANPKNRITSDCVIRAISNACQIEYRQVLRDMLQLEIESGYYNDNTMIEKILNHYGWRKMGCPRKIDNTRMTFKEFIPKLGSSRVVANAGCHHLTCIVDGKINDIWDCSSEKVGIYYVKI